jgi:uncharacterized protein (DUF608 family)
MQPLFPSDVPERKWAQFTAEGFSKPVSGVVFCDEEVVPGVPLGGIGTGCIDLNSNGCLGRCSIFNSFAPPRELNIPFLGVVIDNTSYCLTTVADVSLTRRCPRIRYWGHYPMADLEYELNSSSSIGLQAWAPFILGDAKTSNCPIAFFELRLRNLGSSKQHLKLVFTFPGPSRQESRTECYSHSEVRTDAMRGACVEWNGGSYVMLCSTDVEVVSGGHVDGSSWSGIADRLPEIEDTNPGRSVSADFELDANNVIEITFALAWYVPRWSGSEAHCYQHAYAERFKHAKEAAEAGLSQQRGWHKRILGWQQEVYNDTFLPVWLRDQLVNVLHTITKDSFWASRSIPGQSWYGNQGLFGLTESPRTTPHICNPSDWYGNLPLVLFFPELMHSLLRSYVHFQLQTGEVPLGIGEDADFAGQPVYQTLHPMNSCVHIHLIDRLWQRNRDPNVLQEFYPSALKALGYMRSLDGDGDGLPELDADPIPNHFYGAWPWYGLSIYVSGFWLAALKMMERMSAACGDVATQSLCLEWSRRASQAVENILWNDSSYLLYRDITTGRFSATILANQLVGQWCARLHSLPSLYPPNHLQQGLQTVLDKCGEVTRVGLLNAADVHGKLDHSGTPQSDGIFTGECLSAAATIIYEGRANDGIEMARRMMEAIVVQSRAGWEMPNLLNSDGKIIHGNDFYQMMIVWALPLALRGEGISEICVEGSWIDRILKSCGAEQ